MNTTTLALLTLMIGFGFGYVLAGREPGWGSHMMPSGQMMDDREMAMGSAMQGMLAALKETSGDDFDRTFLEEMITHHEGELQIASAALGSARRSEIKDFAYQSFASRSAEISQLKKWQEEWYGK